MRSSPSDVCKCIVNADNRWLPTTCGSPEVRFTTGFQARTTAYHRTYQPARSLYLR